MFALDRELADSISRGWSAQGCRRSRFAPVACHYRPMGIRTRNLDMIAALRRDAADRAKRDEAARVIDRWNQAIAAGRDMWWSPTIRAAMVAGMP